MTENSALQQLEKACRDWSRVREQQIAVRIRYGAEWGDGFGDCGLGRIEQPE